jgi:nucleoside phosphorylase/ActR/RegA family two-component response regulator
MKNILWIDDDEELLNQSEPMFARYGFRIIKATTVGRALTMLRNERVDGVLLDVRLSGGESGLELLQELQTRTLKVAVFTAYPDYEDHLTAEESGASAYFEKINKSIPLDPEQQRAFFAALHKIFADKQHHTLAENNTLPSNPVPRHSKRHQPPAECYTPVHHVATTMTNASGTDFGVVAPLAVELESILSALGQHASYERVALDTRTYYTITFPTSTATEYRIVLTLLPSMGNLASALATHDLLQHWRPKNLIVTGIAGGTNPAEQKIGDILIPDSILYYELGKLRPNKTEVRPRMLTVDPTLYDRALNYHATRRSEQRVHFGPIASGEKVYANTAAVKRLLRLHPKIVGIEMESAGAASAALSAVEKTGFFAVRAISDFADAKKDDTAHARAAIAAATWLANFLRTSPVPALGPVTAILKTPIVLPAPAPDTRVVLFTEMTKRLDNEDFKTLCFILGVDVDELPGEKKSARVRELILHFERREELEKLAGIWATFPQNYLS